MSDIKSVNLPRFAESKAKPKFQYHRDTVVIERKGLFPTVAAIFAPDVQYTILPHRVAYPAGFGFTNRMAIEKRITAALYAPKNKSYSLMGE